MYNVAIVDDDFDILNMLKKFLERSKKYNVTVYSNPLEAIGDIKDNRYEIVLLDIMMPQMNGLDLLNEINQNNEEQKVIMMTAYSTLDKVLTSHKNGAVHYFMKPFLSLEAFEEKIQEIID